MRKLKFAGLLSGSLLLILSACSKEKDYNCVYEFKMNNVTYRTETHVIKAESSDRAGFACSAYEVNHNSVDCAIR
ncbi:MAG: hypothetical protein WC756_06745 [Taibaiella sp.]|jgi:hypothetical protein